MKKIEIDKGNKCYLIITKDATKQLPFETVMNKRDGLAKELRKPKLKTGTKGTLKAYNEYIELLKLAHQKHLSTGWKCTTELNYELIGTEGKRVEFTTETGETIRLWVEHSTGFIPHHVGRKSKATKTTMPIPKYDTFRVIE
jgi:hypothetical protein